MQSICSRWAFSLLAAYGLMSPGCQGLGPDFSGSRDSVGRARVDRPASEAMRRTTSTEQMSQPARVASRSMGKKKTEWRDPFLEE